MQPRVIEYLCVLLMAVSWTDHARAMLWAGTMVVVDEGSYVSDNLAESYGWRDGVLDLINGRSRTVGWCTFFNEWTDTSTHYAIQANTTEELNRVIAKFAAIDSDRLTLRLSLMEHPAYGLGTLDELEIPRSVRTAEVKFSVGSQQQFDHMMQVGLGLIVTGRGIDPPVLTLYLGNPDIFLFELDVPDHLIVVLANPDGPFPSDSTPEKQQNIEQNRELAQVWLEERAEHLGDQQSDIPAMIGPTLDLGFTQGVLRAGNEDVAEPVAPGLNGAWRGEGWGDVTLHGGDGVYVGSYSDTYGRAGGGITLTWSADTGRFDGVWREGSYRHGTLSIRLLDDGSIRGAWTTDTSCEINSGIPALADLEWVAFEKEGIGDRPQQRAGADGEDEVEIPTVILTVGQTHVVELAEDRSAGMEWSMTQQGDSVLLSASRFVPDDPVAPRGKGTRQLTYEARSPGEVMLILHYKRQGASDDEAVAIHQTRVIVVGAE